MTSAPSTLLRRTLFADAAASFLCGLLMALDAALLESWLGVPAALLRGAGLALLPFAALVLWLARRPTLPRAAVIAVIACNALWAIDCLALLLSGWLAPTALGTGFLIVQAALVGLFADLQYLGLRRSPASVPA